MVTICSVDGIKKRIEELKRKERTLYTAQRVVRYQYDCTLPHLQGVLIWTPLDPPLGTGGI